MPVDLLATLLAHPNRDLDGSAIEAELLAQAAFDEASIASLEEAAGKEHEARGAGGCLCCEQDPRLLARTHGVRFGRGHGAQEGIEAPSGHAGVPGLERGLDRGNKTVHVATSERRDVDAGAHGIWTRLLLDLASR